VSETTPRRVHFVAIGGAGMGSLAGLLHARGVQVTGSDEVLYPPMSTALEQWGIRARRGFRAEHVLEADPDLVVIGNAVRPDNPEARAAIDEGLPHLSFPDALYQLAIAGRHSVVVAGTHGKTTTTSLIAYLLHATGLDPSLLVGGISLDFGGSFREGRGEHFVVEGDEYDTAFFDKTPKFLHYGARTAMITSVEFDHADIYRDLDHVKEAFRSLVARLPADGTLIAATDHADVCNVVRGAPCRVVGYGLTGDRAGDWRAGAVTAAATGTRFEVIRTGRAPVRARVPLHGRCNVENALGALAMVDALGMPVERAAGVLAGFRGVKRRQEVRGEARGVTVVDDFAHHPTAVAASIGALRARYPGRRLIAVFEPRTNTSRRGVFQRDYARAFDGAARVIVSVVPDAPIYSATGDVTERLSAAQLAADLESRGLPAVAVDGVDAIVALLHAECEAGDVVLVMSNGAFGNIWERLLEALRDV
jgi:UDP-N-acetylmuramate: L-alanyl-gamma-D-glutamyl-meso-diaminopimelate ligase